MAFAALGPIISFSDKYQPTISNLYFLEKDGKQRVFVICPGAITG